MVTRHGIEVLTQIDKRLVSDPVKLERELKKRFLGYVCKVGRILCKECDKVSPDMKDACEHVQKGGPQVCLDADPEFFILHEEHEHPAHGHLGISTGCSVMDSPSAIDVQVRCVREHADAERLIAWIRDPERKGANTAFTAGPDRDVAREIEFALAQAEKRN